MEKKESKGKQVKAKELQSSLSVKMLNIVTQFDMAYGKLRTLKGELGGIPKRKRWFLSKMPRRLFRISPASPGSFAQK